MTKKVIVLGNGMIGSAVAERLLSPDYRNVTIADIKFEYMTDFKFRCKHCDFSEDLDIKLDSYDLAVNCAPSKYGYKVAKYILEQGVDCVDIAFYEEDPFTLNELAHKTGATYIPDAGFAPGLTNLLFGKKFRELGDKLWSAEIGVGGVAKSPFEPYGYSVTWSLEDLMEEYERPARFVQNGEIVTTTNGNPVVPAEVNNIDMEGLLTDGLRTLLRYRKNMKHMEEYTIRWPGHYDKVLPMMRKSKTETIKELKDKCSGVDDTVVMQCMFNHDEMTMVLHGKGTETAMVRATAGTCAVICDVVMDGKFMVAGVHPPEELGRREGLCDDILAYLEIKEGIIIKESQ